jgi:hypothetical protein
MEIEYIGEILMGENRQPSFVVWDTGSDWLVVESKTCSNCYGSLYDFDQSPNTFNRLETEGTREYGTTYTEGFEARDRVCLLDYY